jgi:hypothetical protein
MQAYNTSCSCDQYLDAVNTDWHCQWQQHISTQPSKHAQKHAGGSDRIHEVEVLVNKHDKNVTYVEQVLQSST